MQNWNSEKPPSAPHRTTGRALRVPTRHAGSAGAAIALGSMLMLGCGSIAKIDRDLDTHPITDTGVAATILMPGQTGVPMPNRNPQGGLAPPGGGAAAGSASSGAAAAPSGGGMVMIGGTSQDIEKHQKVNNEPAWAKVLKLPFAVAAYPFKKAHQAMTGPADPTVKISGPPPEAPPTPAELQAQRERALLEGMEKELASGGGSPPPPRQNYNPQVPQNYGASASPQNYGQPAQSAHGSNTHPGAGATPQGSTNRPRSIAEELAALRASVTASRGAPQVASATPAPRSAPAPAAAPAVERLYESVDRDADGRVDQWIYRTGQETTSEASDEDGDGRPERRVWFAQGTRDPQAEEEDTNADGRADTFTEYESGAIARRRADTDGDGEIDTWSFYRDGELLRHEQDTDGDGFRDRMSFYEAGRLAREEEDRDGNGRPDRVTEYDEHEKIAHQEEDTNRDDVMDVRSFYQEGKLRRRELIR